MAEQEKRRAKTTTEMTRTVTVSVRLDPKLKYLADLAAREQRRALSSYIEWAVDQSLEKCELGYFPDGSQKTLADEADYLWDIDEADRLVKLALRYPHLLTHEEQILWKLIRENGRLWRGSYKPTEWKWTVDESSIVWERLRADWPTFVAVASGEKDATSLPTWPKTKPIPSKSSPFDSMDDDIPF